jgi:multidrug efflux pump subunit AcrB
LGPFVNDDFGRVAVASIAVTAPGYSMGEMRVSLKEMRDRLYALPGVDRISFYGLQEERVYLEFDRPKLAQLGLTPQGVIDQLVKQNVVLSGGQIAIGGINASLAVSGEVRDAAFAARVADHDGASSGCARCFACSFNLTGRACARAGTTCRSSRVCCSL